MVQWAVALAGGLQCSSLRGPGVCSAAPSKARALRRAVVRTGHASVGGSTPSSSATLAAPLTPLIIFPPSVRAPLPPTRTLAAAKRSELGTSPMKEAVRNRRLSHAP